MVDEKIASRTFYEVPLDVYTGKELTKEGELVYADDQIVNDENYVIVRFNEKVYKRFLKYFPRVVQQRGIKVTDQIDEQDRDVAFLINKAKTKNKGRVTRDEISAIVQRVKNLHEPQNSLISFQVLLWCILYDDLFTVTGKSLDCRFDVDLEDYWEGTKVTEDDELDKLLSSDMFPPDPFVDRNEPLEIMLAVVTTFISKHQELSKAMQPFLKKAYVGIGAIRGAETSSEDAIFLSEQLDDLLS